MIGPAANVANASRRSPVLLWLLLGGGLIGVLLLAIAGFLFWGYNLFSTQAEQALARNPVIERHIGAIHDFEFDLSATGDDPDPEVFVMRLRGSRGNGVATAKFVTVDADSERIDGGMLVMDSGERYDLEPDAMPAVEADDDH